MASDDDFTPLISPNHWLGWVGDDPASIVRNEIEGMLQNQQPNSKLEWVRLKGEPEYLTGGTRVSNDPSKITVIRAGFAVLFELQVLVEGQQEQLSGVFSWVVMGLDTERRDRVFLDLHADIQWAGEMLKLRIYDPDVALSLPKPSSRKWQFWRKN